MKRLGLFLSTLSLTLPACKSEDSSTDSVERVTLTISGASSLSLGGDTEQATLKAYEFWIAKNSDCSSAVQVFEDEDGKEVDMNQGPEIGSGEVETGTYNCVIMVMSDTLKFTPKTTSGVCTAGEEFSLDVFQSRGEDVADAVLPDGTTVEAEASEQKVAVYISTLSTSTGGGENSNAFAAPTSSAKTNGIKLSSAFEVTANKSGTMVMDTSGTVESNSGDCDMQPPTFGFE